MGLIRTDISEERIASIFSVEKIRGLQRERTLGRLLLLLLLLLLYLCCAVSVIGLVAVDSAHK
jgi:hypothetical protein